MRDVYTIKEDYLVVVACDRISAFDCIWHGENGLNGVPGKGAALNAVQIAEILANKRSA